MVNSCQAHLRKIRQLNQKLFLFSIEEKLEKGQQTHNSQ